MKSDVIKKPFPASLKEWEQLIAEAPGEETAPDLAEEQVFWDKAVVVREGGPKAVHEALKAKRDRGPQNTPIKQLISIRLSPEVVDYFKSTGKGWQTRMDKVLLDYIKTHR